MTRPDSWQLRLARRTIDAGGIVAYPTEGVYGLGCDPLNPDAIDRLLGIKRRDAAKGFILIAAGRDQLAPYIEPLPAATEKQLAETWPGPVTWLLPAAPDVPDWLTGGRNTLAARVSAHPLVRALCDTCDQALISTSANLSGHPAAHSALTVRRRLGGAVDFILSGPLGGRTRPTEIRDAATGRIVRAG
ncbi:MAG TPA: Sua5/YciO/YrdC/YwlC family protein [Gammaproteobacteria bacterium]|nr:Sua5/YciO/YrdC/YwlC family protein [Gammaproteobacteria bacterium]